MIFGLFDWLKIAGGAVIGAAIGFGVGYWQGHGDGYEKHLAEIAAATVRAEMERKGDDVKLQGMSDYDLCVAGLRGSGMPVSACDALRGLDEK